MRGATLVGGVYGGMDRPRWSPPDTCDALASTMGCGVPDVSFSGHAELSRNPRLGPGPEGLEPARRAASLGAYPMARNGSETKACRLHYAPCARWDPLHLPRRPPEAESNPKPPLSMEDMSPDTLPARVSGDVSRAVSSASFSLPTPIFPVSTFSMPVAETGRTQPP